MRVAICFATIFAVLISVELQQTQGAAIASSADAQTTNAEALLAVDAGVGENNEESATRNARQFGFGFRRPYYGGYGFGYRPYYGGGFGYPGYGFGGGGYGYPGYGFPGYGFGYRPFGIYG